MPERERRVGRVDYSEGAQLRAHIDREVMGKVSQSALSTLLKELTNPGGSRKWEDEDCPPWKCPKDKTICNCKQGGGIGKASQISCQKFRDFMGWPTYREQHECLFKEYKKLYVDGDSTWRFVPSGALYRVALCTEWRFVPSGALYRVALCTEWRFPGGAFRASLCGAF